MTDEVAVRLMADDMGTVYKISASTITATADNIASIQVLAKGKIKAVFIAGLVNCETNDGSAQLEVSISPVRSIGSTIVGVNTLCGATYYSNFVTSGKDNSAINAQCYMDQAVEVLDRIYLHAVIGGTAALNAEVWVHIA